jgi:hypothetical protein
MNLDTLITKLSEESMDIWDKRNKLLWEARALSWLDLRLVESVALRINGQVWALGPSFRGSKFIVIRTGHSAAYTLPWDFYSSKEKELPYIFDQLSRCLKRKFAERYFPGNGYSLQEMAQYAYDFKENARLREVQEMLKTFQDKVKRLASINPNPLCRVVVIRNRAYPATYGFGKDDGNYYVVENGKALQITKGNMEWLAYIIGLLEEEVVKVYCAEHGIV